MKKTTRIADLETEVRTGQLPVRMTEIYRYINLHRKAVVLLCVTRSVIVRIKKNY
jgi:hypothetical protein